MEPYGVLCRRDISPSPSPHQLGARRFHRRPPDTGRAHPGRRPRSAPPSTTCGSWRTFPCRTSMTSPAWRPPATCAIPRSWWWTAPPGPRPTPRASPSCSSPRWKRCWKAAAASLNPGAASVSGAITGSQLGAILAFLSSKVLGQYDPFSALAENSTAPAAGRLLLVAPNIISVERELNVEPEDFRLWVCLHEQTHRVQFAAAPVAAAPHAGRDRKPQRPAARQRRFPDGAGLRRGEVAEGPHGVRRSPQPRRHPGPAAEPRGKGRPLPPDRPDEPARGPRQRGDGRRGRQHRAVGEDHPAALQRPRPRTAA